METTFELQLKSKSLDKKRILENLRNLENVHNVSVDEDTASITFGYLLFSDLGRVRRELDGLGYTVINDAQHFDNPEEY